MLHEMEISIEINFKITALSWKTSSVLQFKSSTQIFLLNIFLIQMRKSSLRSNISILLLLAVLMTLSFSQTIVIRNIGCKSSNTLGVCIACATRYYLDSQNICQPVNPNCNTYDSLNGACLTCYPGFGIIENTCLPGIVSSNFDPNCNTFNGSACAKCSSGFFLNAQGKCQNVNPACKTYDNGNGLCTSCFSGYEVQNGNCAVSLNANTIANCNQIDQLSGKCVKCSFGYYFDQNGNCKQADPNCKSFDSLLQKCIDCYPGYTLDLNNQCIKSQDPILDPNCAKQDSHNICLQCSKGAIFNSNKSCIIVDPSCLTHDDNTGLCTSCYSGYIPSSNNSVCVLAQNGPNPNPYCAKWQGNNCVSCALGSYFNADQICVVSDPNCKSTLNNICNSCYDGYTLDTSTNQCIKSVIEPQTNSLCSKWNGQICTQCSKGTYFNSFNICSVANPLCMTFNQSNGNCLSCYSGYNLLEGNCELANATGPIDPYCQKFLTQDICSQCSDRYFIGSNGICQEVNPLCRTFDQLSGSCTSCFPGFSLSIGLCTLSTQNITDVNCKTWKGTVCLECAFGAFFGNDGVCLVASALCKTFNIQNGVCLTCYDSFDLISGTCVKNTNQTVSDPNCAEFMQGICMKCSVGYFFQNNGLCGIVSSDCKTHDIATGGCLSCYLGFSLINGECIKGNDTSVIDPNCASFVSGACVKCSKNFFFDSLGVCEAVSPLCQTYDPLNGNCLTCYQSFILNNGACIEDKNNTQGDSNCASWLSGICTACASRTFMNVKGLCQNVNIDCNTYNSLDGSCTSCYAGFSLLDGKCSQSTSPNSCAKFDKTGACIQCGKGSYLSQGTCIAIDPQCANFDVSTVTCLSCYSGYTVLNGACQISKVDASSEVQNCYAYDINSQCIKCYDRFYLSNNICQSVNVFCKTYDDHNGNCLSCFTTFTLSNGKCNQ